MNGYNPVTGEPSGWPLRRPLTSAEWHQVMKAMVIRRVPEGRSIDRQTLLGFAREDIRATIESGKLWLEPGYPPANFAGNSLEKLIKDQTLREGVVGYNPNFPSMPVKNIFRTDYTEEFVALLPRHIVAVIDFFPVKNELELLASLMQDPETDLPTIQPIDPRRSAVDDLLDSLGIP